MESVWAELCQSQTALAVLPTGGGKTICIAELMRRAIEARPDIRIDMVMGRIELVSQTEQALSAILPRRSIGVYCGSLHRKELNRLVTVASIQSVSEIDMPHSNLLVIDEVHNLDQKKGRYLNLIEKAQNKNPRLKIVGFTATPFRSDGEIFSPRHLFKRICYRKTIQEMIALGFLCPPILKASRDEFDISKLRIRAGEFAQEDIDILVADKERCKEQVIDALSRAKDRYTLAWACANIDHCNLVAGILMNLGERATTIHSKLKAHDRSTNLASFMTGEMRHIVFVTVLSEGFDHPPIDVIVLMRPTRSPVLYVQTVGRGLRICPEKSNLLVLDYGQVVRTIGPLDEPNVIGKSGVGRKENIVKESALKCCPSCMTYNKVGIRNCTECDYEFPVPPPPSEKLDKQASETAKILSEKAAPTMECLGPAYIEMHEAKSGNLCIKISYCNSISYLSRDATTEYFVTTSMWAMDRLERRLGDLGASLPSIPIPSPILVEGTFEVVKTKDGKYDRVLSVKKVSDQRPGKKTQQMSFYGAEPREPGSDDDERQAMPTDLSGWDVRF